jgi:hypothetical protein
MMSNDLMAALSRFVVVDPASCPPDAPATAPCCPSRPRARPLPMPVGAFRAFFARLARPPARRTRPGRPPSPGYAPRPPAKAPSPKAPSGKAPAEKKPSAKDPLAFLHDPTLSIEDKLILLLGYLGEKWEKEMQAKMDEIAASEAKKQSDSKPSGSSGSSGSKKKSGGLLGSLGFVGDVIEAAISPATAALKVPAIHDVLKQVGGPILAAGASALGAPELAPLLLKSGPELVDMAANLASSLDGAGGGGSGSSGGGSSSGGGGSKPASGGGKALSDAETQMMFMQIQRIQQKQQEMFGVVSAVLKSNHDLRMGVVNNIR